MTTAFELRARAWAKLGQGNLLKAVGAFGLYWLMGFILAQGLTHIGVLTGGIVQMSVEEFLREHGEMFRQMGLALPHPSDLPVELNSMTFPLVMPSFQVIQWFVTTFMTGVIFAGWTVFTMAMMRNGANALQVYSGFTRFFSMGWLMLLRSWLVALWSLLLIVPGIVAFYAYRQAFFLKADHPEWSAWKALAESKKMMDGHKWRLAYLDMTFIGWSLLVVVTFGLAAFFVTPYMGVTCAAFYEDLLDRAEAQSGDAVPA